MNLRAEFVGSFPRAVAGVGMAAFGPLDLGPNSDTYGTITSTPKAGWDGFDPVGAVQHLLPGVPCAITTDVAGAAYGEAHRGAVPGARDLTYLTVGTGVGVGLLRDGELSVGGGWPKAAHIPFQRRPNDVFAKRVGPSGARGSSQSLVVELTALEGEAGLKGALLMAERAVA